MDSLGLWMVIGGAVAIAGICVILLQKKAGEARKYLDELHTLKDQFAEQSKRVEESQNNDNVAKDLQSKIDALSATLQSAKDQNTQLQAELTEAKDSLRRADEEINELADIRTKLEENSKNDSNDSEKLADEIATLKKELEEKKQELATVEERFEKKMDEVVQSSIQKISHAEQAKEEAIQAAQDNFEAAAAANTKLKEKEELIKQLQG
jgi:chromosome segregation ATPase